MNLQESRIEALQNIAEPAGQSGVSWLICSCVVGKKKMW